MASAPLLSRWTWDGQSQSKVGQDVKGCNRRGSGSGVGRSTIHTPVGPLGDRAGAQSLRSHGLINGVPLQIL